MSVSAAGGPMQPTPPFQLVIRTLALALCVASLTAVAAAADDRPDAEAFGLAGPPRAKSMKPAPEALSRQVGVDVSLAPQTSLSRLDVDRLLRDDALTDRFADKVIRYGVGGDVGPTVRDGGWADLADGRRLWVAELPSPMAIGLRVHFCDVQLPPGGRLAVYAADLGGADPAKNRVEL